MALPQQRLRSLADFLRMGRSEAWTLKMWEFSDRKRVVLVDGKEFSGFELVLSDTFTCDVGRSASMWTYAALSVGAQHHFYFTKGFKHGSRDDAHAHVWEASEWFVRRVSYGAGAPRQVSDEDEEQYPTDDFVFAGYSTVLWPFPKNNEGWPTFTQERVPVLSYTDLDLPDEVATIVEEERGHIQAQLDALGALADPTIDPAVHVERMRERLAADWRRNQALPGQLFFQVAPGTTSLAVDPDSGHPVLKGAPRAGGR